MTPNDTDMAVLIDARGHRCPVPTLRLRRALETVPSGVTVQLWADDPMAQIDVPHFCNQNNCLLLSSETLGTGWMFMVQGIG